MSLPCQHVGGAVLCRPFAVIVLPSSAMRLPLPLKACRSLFGEPQASRSAPACSVRLSHAQCGVELKHELIEGV